MELLKKIGEKIFEEMFKHRFETIEQKIVDLEKHNLLLQKTVDDLQKDVDEVYSIVNSMQMINAKMDGTITTLLMLAGDKLKKIGNVNSNK